MAVKKRKVISEKLKADIRHYRTTHTQAETAKMYHVSAASVMRACNPKSVEATESLAKAALAAKLGQSKGLMSVSTEDFRILVSIARRLDSAELEKLVSWVKVTRDE